MLRLYFIFESWARFTNEMGFWNSTLASTIWKALKWLNDRRCHCSIFVCFEFFVVPNLLRSSLEPISVRFGNLATLSSAAARWIFDLTWISRTVYAIVATWLSFGSFCVFRAFSLRWVM